jgi:hypothetical protein
MVGIAWRPGILAVRVRFHDGYDTLVAQLSLCSHYSLHDVILDQFLE